MDGSQQLGDNVTSPAELVIRGAQDRAYRLMTAVGLKQSQETLAAEAQDYWSNPSPGRWEADSHWSGSSPFRGSDLWSQIGARHLRMVERASATIGVSRPWERVVEWGCGGGANAVHFAPLSGEFVGVDISEATLDECGRQVTAACKTPWKPVHVDVLNPESATSDISPCDLWLSFYVFELLPSREYGERLLKIAYEALRPGGLAYIQIKYSDGSWSSRPRRWRYRTGIAGMTAYRIEEFWELAARTNFVPELVELRPADELQGRYAYFALTRPDS